MTPNSRLPSVRSTRNRALLTSAIAVAEIVVAALNGWSVFLVLAAVVLTLGSALLWVLHVLVRRAHEGGSPTGGQGAGR